MSTASSKSLLHRLGTACVVAGLALAVPCNAATPALQASQPAAQGVDPTRLAELDAFMQRSTDARGYLGGVVLIARSGRIVDFQAYGHRDLARKQPMRRDDIFRIYSMTKTIASVAVMQLVERGKLTLDDPVAKYIPGFAAIQVVDGGTPDVPVLRAPRRAPTIHDLLTHTAGFPGGREGDATAIALQERRDPHGAADLAGFTARLAAAPLAADPGTRFAYDSAAIETAARVVEIVSGQPFAEYLHQHVLAPLRMVDTGFEVPAAQRARVVDTTTMGEDGRLRIADGPSARVPGARLNAYDSAAGGLYSTAGDYARFAQMLLDGGTLDGARILGRKTVDLMLMNHLTMLDPPVTQFSAAEGFGIGGSVLLDVARRGVPGSVGQYGWPGAASTSYTIDRHEQLVTVLMLQHLPNGKPDDLPRVSRNVQALVYQSLSP